MTCDLPAITIRVYTIIIVGIHVDKDSVIEIEIRGCSIWAVEVSMVCQVVGTCMKRSSPPLTRGWHGVSRARLLVHVQYMKRSSPPLTRGWHGVSRARLLVHAHLWSSSQEIRHAVFLSIANLCIILYQQ